MDLKFPHWENPSFSPAQRPRPHYGGSRMADIMMFVASVEWIVLGILTFWKLKGWNKKMDELYENMKKWAVDE